MPVADADIVVYGSAVMPTTDVTTQIGGAIDTQKKVTFTDIDPTGLVEMLSSAAGDTTQTVTIDYLDAAGNLAAETKTLNGTTAVAFVASMSAILRALKSATTTGTITIRKSGAGATLITMEKTPNEIFDVRRPFFNAQANASGGATKTYYEKVFVRNNHATLALTSATILEQTDVNAVVDFALEAVLNGTTDNGVGNNRQVAPTGFLFDSTTKSVANVGVLSPVSAQGVWLRLTLVAGISPADTSWTARLSGISQ